MAQGIARLIIPAMVLFWYRKVDNNSTRLFSLVPQGIYMYKGPHGGTRYLKVDNNTTMFCNVDNNITGLFSLVPQG